MELQLRLAREHNKRMPRTTQTLVRGHSMPLKRRSLVSCCRRPDWSPDSARVLSTRQKAFFRKSLLKCSMAGTAVSIPWPTASRACFSLLPMRFASAHDTIVKATGLATPFTRASRRLQNDRTLRSSSTRRARLSTRSHPSPVMTKTSSHCSTAFPKSPNATTSTTSARSVDSCWRRAVSMRHGTGLRSNDSRRWCAIFRTKFEGQRLQPLGRTHEQP